MWKDKWRRKCTEEEQARRRTGDGKTEIREMWKEIGCGERRLREKGKRNQAIGGLGGMGVNRYNCAPEAPNKL